MMNTRKLLIDLLKGLEKAVPPPPRCHHAITFAQYGSDTEGWQDRLALQVNHEGRFHCFFLDDRDLTGDLYKRVIEPVRIAIAAGQTASEQMGVAFGQYLPSDK